MTLGIIDLDGRFGAAMARLGRYSGAGPHPGERMTIKPEGAARPDDIDAARRGRVGVLIPGISGAVPVVIERAAPAGIVDARQAAAIRAAHAIVLAGLPGERAETAARDPAVAVLGAFDAVAARAMAACAADVLPLWDPAMDDIAGRSLVGRTRAPWLAVRVADRAAASPHGDSVVDLAVGVAAAAFILWRDRPADRVAS
ncbi:MAG: hypothetical protein AB7P02_05160 [Alphaproteobacteria bacterium]